MDLRFWSRRNRRKKELDDEIQAHLRMAAEDRIERGEDPDTARQHVLREFGNIALVEDVTRDVWGWKWLEDLGQDLGFGLRMLRRNPGLTAIILLTLTLGIGATTAIFSAVNAVLWRPFPYPHAEKLVALSERNASFSVMNITLPNLRDWQARNTVFEDIEAFRPLDATLTGHGDPQRLQTRQVSAGLFPMLGVEPILGRPFAATDDKPDARPVVLLSDSFWTREFGRDPAVLHKQLLLDGQPYTVVGVVPTSRCHGPWRQMDVFTPLGLMENVIGGPSHRDLHQGVWAYGQLKPGVTQQQAQAEMSAIAEQLARQYPVNAGQGVTVQPLMAHTLKPFRRLLLLLLLAVGFVLLIACANVANLLLSLGIVRRHEIAIRSTLGVGPLRLARQHLCESILLALISGVLGVLVAYIGTAALAGLAKDALPRMEEVSIDHSVLLFAFVISLLTGIAFGVFPTLMALRVDPSELLKDTNHGSRQGLTRVGARAFLAAGQLALSLVLLVATGLSLRSFYNLIRSDLGFRPDHVLTATLRMAGAKYATNEERTRFTATLLQKFATLPDVKAVGAIQPLLGGSLTDFRVEGQAAPRPGHEPYLEMATVTPGAFPALSVKLLGGRYFNADDNHGAPLVVIVDDMFADRAWPGENPLGKRINLDLGSTHEFDAGWKVVGVVRHLERLAGMTPALPEAFVPQQQLCTSTATDLSICNPTDGENLAISVGGNPASLGPWLRDGLYSLDPDLALYDVQPLSEITNSAFAPQRLLVVLLSILAGIALLIAAAGTYGAMFYMVAGRTAEIGVRRALGAERTHVLRLVFGFSFSIVLSGLGVGVVASLILGRLLRPTLLGVKPTDPMVFASVAGLLLIVALSASYIPAQRAMKLNPIEAVRHE
jgi:putative ABC transport system permease protein